MAERTTNHTRCTRVEWHNDEEAVEQFPCRRNEAPRKSNRYVGSDNCTNCRSSGGHIRPEAVPSRWRLIVLGVEIAQAKGEKSEYHWCQETLELLLLSASYSWHARVNTYIGNVHSLGLVVRRSDVMLLDPGKVRPLVRVRTRTSYSCQSQSRYPSGNTYPP